MPILIGEPHAVRLSIVKNHISAPRQNFINHLNSFFDIDMRSQYAKSQLSSFKAKEGVWGDE